MAGPNCLKVGRTPGTDRLLFRASQAFSPGAAVPGKPTTASYFDTFLGDLFVSVLSNSFAEGGAGTALLNTTSFALTSLP